MKELHEDITDLFFSVPLPPLDVFSFVAEHIIKEKILIYDVQQNMLLFYGVKGFNLNIFYSYKK